MRRRPLLHHFRTPLMPSKKDHHEEKITNNQGFEGTDSIEVGNRKFEAFCGAVKRVVSLLELTGVSGKSLQSKTWSTCGEKLSHHVLRSNFRASEKSKLTTFFR